MYSQGSAILRADLRGVVEEAFMQGSLYIGPKVMPPIGVPNSAGQYPKIDKNGGNLLRDETKRRGRGANYARLKRAWGADTYTTIEYGVEVPVDDSDEKDLSRFFSLEATETRRTYEQVQLAHERRVAAAIFNETNFNKITSATAYTAANLATFDIGYDIDLAKAEIANRGENTQGLTVVMSYDMFLRARASTRLQNRIRGTISTDSQLVLSAQAMADALEVKEVIIGRAKYDTSKQGASAVSLSSIWSNSYIWVGNVNPASGPEGLFSGGAGYTLFWEQDAALWQVESYRDESVRSNIIRVRQNTDEKVVLGTAGQLLITQYS